MAGTGYAEGIIPPPKDSAVAYDNKMENEERDETQEQPQPELPVDRAQDKVKGGLWRMLRCCALAVALIRVLWELL